MICGSRPLTTTRNAADTMKPEYHHDGPVSQQLLVFSSSNHNMGIVNELRSTFARNAGIIQSSAAMLPRPPPVPLSLVSALLTVFACVVTAFEGSLTIFGMIGPIFNIMNGFLERLSLLDGRLPSDNVYQMSLSRYLSAISYLSGIMYSQLLQVWLLLRVDQELCQPAGSKAQECLRPSPEAPWLAPVRKGRCFMTA